MKKTNDTVTFAGASAGNITNWEEIFEESYNDDGSVILVSKETFHHEEEGLSFDYKYLMNIIDMSIATCGDIYCIDMSLKMMPEFKCWCEKELLDAARMIGYEEHSIEEIIKYLMPSDALSAGNCITMMSEQVYYDSEENEDGFYDPLDNEEVSKKLNVAASLVQAVDGLKGFYLDKGWNHIGTNGWDVLNHVIKGEDLFKF